MMMAGTLPRGIGKNLYTSPFICSAYSKGMFAVPAGMVDSISIKRGLPEFGWTHQNLPTSVDVSFTIKDLSPSLYVSLAGNSILDPFKGNSSMHEYLTTLSGVGLADRLFGFRKLQRRLAAMLLIKRNTVANPAYWSYSIGNNSMVRLLHEIEPSWKTPTN